VCKLRKELNEFYALKTYICHSPRHRATPNNFGTFTSQKEQAMQEQDFKVYKNDAGALMIEKLTVPRFIAKIAINNPLSDFDKIEFLDTVTEPMQIANIMQRAGTYLYEQIKQGKYKDIADQLRRRNL
jgi:hypothetical protein